MSTSSPAFLSRKEMLNVKISDIETLKGYMTSEDQDIQPSFSSIFFSFDILVFRAFYFRYFYF
jgi:hypothetical protein